MMIIRKIMNKPTNANTECVGPDSEAAGKVDNCAGCPNQQACASGQAKTVVDPALQDIQTRLANIKHKLLVLSGKGGVGKSSVACQLAFSLASKGYQVGLLDIDITGPSVPRMLGLQGHEVHQSASGWSPVYVDDNLGVMSIGFMLPNADDAIIWRGPRKNGLIKQFLTDVQWGTLDYLIIDTPPGTSDEHISVVQYMKLAGLSGGIVVTTPQEVSMMDCRKELNFCVKTKLPVLGIVENMSGFSCPVNDLSFHKKDTDEDISAKVLSCLQTHLDLDMSQVTIQTPIFPTLGAGPEGMAKAFNVPFLGRMPMDRHLTQACEEGKSYVDDFPQALGKERFLAIVDRIIQQLDGNNTS